MKPISIDAGTLRDWLEQGRPVTVLDVRPAPQRAEWSIPGSVHLDAYDALWAGARDALQAFDPPAGTPVVTVCGEGKTSLIAALQLRARGLPALSLTGGMKAWSGSWNVAEVPLAASRAQVLQVRRTGKGCLSYLVGSEGRAAVVDASLDPGLYLELAAGRGWRVAEVIETHVHADHVSRAAALAERAGATLRLPEQRRTAFEHVPVRDGDAVPVGAASLRALRTPGHTFESTCYLLDEAALFTGDTLFPEAVGRPDLEASPDETRERARALHGSLRRLMALPEATLVLAAHAPAPVPFDGSPVMATLGEARRRIPILGAPEAEFVKSLLARIPPTPPNHALIVKLNEAGVLPGGDLTELEAGANRCAVM